MKYTIFSFLISLSCSATCLGMAGTSVVAKKGQAVKPHKGCPKGLGELVNDDVRTTGWNSFFSEWPNDVTQYAMQPKSMDDVNRLVEKLAAIESDEKLIYLCCETEPTVLGWTNSLEKGNGISAIFSIGDQKRMDEWYARVRKPFGLIEFVACPAAVPPTLTLFVANPLIDLEKLRIPEGVTVEMGNVPTVWRRSNTKPREGPKSKPKEVPAKERPPAIRDAVKAIESFLEKSTQKLKD